MPRMTVELLSRCTGHARKKRGEGPEQLLQRVTHLHCAEKGIQKIESLSSCHSLSVLYLYDNIINCIEGLSSCPCITHLYLHNNHISRMEGLEGLKRLSKLYLSGNAIMVVEGLEQCRELAELHIANQQLPEGEKLLFDPRTLRAIAPSLNLLNVSGNGLDSLENLSPLHQLTHFSASLNSLKSMKDISRTFSHWPKLCQVKLSGNPVCRRHKYRDRIITMGTCIGMLDDRAVMETERQFLANWKATRKAHRKEHHLQLQSHAPAVKHAQHSLSRPLAMPALPTRSPLRDWRRRKEIKGSEAGRLPKLLPSPLHTKHNSHPHNHRSHTLPTGTAHDIIPHPLLLPTIN